MPTSTAPETGLEPPPDCYTEKRGAPDYESLGWASVLSPDAAWFSSETTNAPPAAGFQFALAAAARYGSWKRETLESRNPAQRGKRSREKVPGQDLNLRPPGYETSVARSRSARNRMVPRPQIGRQGSLRKGIVRL